MAWRLAENGRWLVEEQYYWRVVYRKIDEVCESSEVKHSMRKISTPESVDCNLCGADDGQVILRPSQSPGPIVRCRHCGLVYVNPRMNTKAIIYEGPEIGEYPSRMLTSSDLDDLTGCWEKSLVEEEEAELSAKVVNAHRALDRIEQLMSHKGTILDLGCFCGTFLHVAAERGWASYGIEPLVGPAIYARGKFGLNVITDTLRDDSFPPEFFDVVTAFQVFEHLPDPVAELAKIWRILKPGGLLVVEVPNIDTVWVRLMGKHHRHFVADHLYFFSPQTLEALLRKVGFTVLKIQAWPRTLSLRKVALQIELIIGVSFGKIIATVVRRTNLHDSMITVDFGDIICAFAQKVQFRKGHLRLAATGQQQMEERYDQRVVYPKLDKVYNKVT